MASVFIVTLVPDPRISDQDDENELVRRAQQDPREFESLYDAYFTRVHRFFQRRVSSPEQAEDLCAQTFLRALEHLDSYRPGKTPFGAWIFRIARNLLIDTYRVSGRTVSLEKVLEPSYESSVLEDIHVAMQRDALRAAMNHLTPTERAVLALRVADEHSHAEIAAILGKKETAVKMAYARGVAHLRSLLNP